MTRTSCVHFLLAMQLMRSVAYCGPALPQAHHLTSCWGLTTHVTLHMRGLSKLALARAHACQPSLAHTTLTHTHPHPQVDWLTEKMRQNNFTVASMHGDMVQKERDAIMAEFRCVCVYV